MAFPNCALFQILKYCVRGFLNKFEFLSPSFCTLSTSFLRKIHPFRELNMLCIFFIVNVGKNYLGKIFIQKRIVILWDISLFGNGTPIIFLQDGEPNGLPRVSFFLQATVSSLRMSSDGFCPATRSNIAKVFGTFKKSFFVLFNNTKSSIISSKMHSTVYNCTDKGSTISACLAGKDW